MREEDNIEKDGLQEDNQNDSDSDVYDGLNDFVEYDDLTGLEGLPQLDELDGMDDLSAVPEVAASIKMDDSKLNESGNDYMEIPLPDIGITEEDGVASELSDGKDIQTTFPQLEPEEDVSKDMLPADEELVTEPAEDISGETAVPEETEEQAEDTLSISEEEPEEDVTPLPEGEEESGEDMMSLSEGEEESGEDIMSLSEGEEEPEEDIMSLSESEEPEEDIMSLSEDGADSEDADSADIDDMLGGLLDDLDTNGSIDAAEGDITDTSKETESKQADDIEDLLGMLSDDSSSEDIMSLDNASADAVPDINDIPDMLIGESGEEDIANILPTEDSDDSEAEKPGFFKKVFGNVVTDEIAEAERQAKEEEEAKLEEAEKLKEEKAAEKAQKKEEKAKLKAEKAEEKVAKKAKKAEEKAAKKAEKLAKKEEEEAAAAQEVVGKLNKAGVTIVVLLGMVLLLGTVILTNSFSGSLDKKKAKNYFDMSKYSQAYEYAVGTNMKKKDPEQYQKIVTVMKVQHSIDAYHNYENVKKYPEALDALLMGLKKYDANKKTAYDLEIEDKLESVYQEILDILSEEFYLSKSQAYDILSLSGGDYTKKVNEMANK
ncbi:hypothetical protein [Butyribacter sp.]|uniref:hypothetical protein n=1 Tax=Butyribacter sp. TaxID=2822465 RepID=UPI002A959A52|nr:hypothetical protein [Butyribacter sp.]